SWWRLQVQVAHSLRLGLEVRVRTVQPLPNAMGSQLRIAEDAPDFADAETNAGMQSNGVGERSSRPHLAERRVDALRAVASELNHPAANPCRHPSRSPRPRLVLQCARERVRAEAALPLPHGSLVAPDLRRNPARTAPATREEDDLRPLHQAERRPLPTRDQLQLAVHLPRHRDPRRRWSTSHGDPIVRRAHLFTPPKTGSHFG